MRDQMLATDALLFNREFGVNLDGFRYCFDSASQFLAAWFVVSCMEVSAAHNTRSPGGRKWRYFDGAQHQI